MIRIAQQEKLKRSARNKFSDFVDYTFDNLRRPFEPEANRYIRNWHTEVLCSELDALLLPNPKCRFLAIGMPPRHGKSEHISRKLPPYFFGKYPNKNVIGTAYGDGLAGAMSRDVQKTMESLAYHDVFPNIRLSKRGAVGDEARTHNHFTIVGHRGSYRSAGIQCGITGHGGDLIIIDDPIKNRKEAESETIRNNIIEEWKSTLRTRLQPNGRVVLLMTRWHEDDLAGHVIKQMKADSGSDQWRVISFPALYEKTEYSHPLDYRQEGQALWPEQYPEKELLKIKATLGSYNFSALFQQRPQPAGGTVIKREWFVKFLADSPEGLRWIRYWDLAVGDKKQNDHTASFQVAMDADENVYIRGGIRGKWQWPTTRKILIATAIREGIEVGIEDFATQKGFVQDLQSNKELHNISIKGHSLPADKLTRALPWIAKLEAGKFYICGGGAWVNDFIDEAVRFCGAASNEDDQIDAVSGGYAMLADVGGISVLGDLS